MRTLPTVPLGRHGICTVREALAAGWTYESLSAAAASGRIVRHDRGVYGPSVLGNDPEDERSRLAARSVAAALAVRGSVPTHRSSAVLAGLPLWTTPDRACITVRPRYTGDARHAHLHRATLRPSDVLAGDVPRSFAARTITDVARECGLIEAVVVGDAALHRGLTDAVRVAESAAFCASWPGHRSSDVIAQLLDGRAESPLESASRLKLVFAGLPPPQPQTEIFDLHGYFLGRVDLFWDAFGVVGEVDGKVKFREKPDEVAFRQTRRQGLLERTGLIVVRWGRADLGVMPWLVSRLEDAFAEGALRPPEDRRWIARPTGLFVPRTQAV